MIDEVASAAATLRGLGNGLRVSQALYVAAELVPASCSRRGPSGGAAGPNCWKP